ncbi:MAG TPA: isocitrate lyase/phosphoenolpyruvate mutase family protein [Stellaceae bacterium]|nr:isocitrate lyase/phosphoenolpyruvate mutase family protein [Stellaceae bacterium]
MSWSERRRRFRAMLAGDECFCPASVPDPLTARIAEELGFESAMLAGSTASLGVLAAPDNCAITLSELAEQALRISRASEIPLIVDADHGYGNALNVMRTIQELETAGLACITIEDTWLPQRFGPKEGFISQAEAVGKVKAALAARRDPDLAIAGRTTLGKGSGMGDVIERSRAFVEAGVDAIFVSGIRTREQMDALAEHVPDTVFMLGATPLTASRDYLASRRVRLALQGHHQVRAAVQAIYSTLKLLREGMPQDRLPNLASDELMARLTREADYAKAVDDFMRE